MSDRIDVKVPDIGDFTEVPVVEVLVEVGDRVSPEQSLVTLESDKATMEVPSPAGGKVVEVPVAVGDEVSEGDVIAVLEPEQDADEERPDQDESEGDTAEEESAGEGDEDREEEKGREEDTDKEREERKETEEQEERKEAEDRGDEEEKEEKGEKGEKDTEKKGGEKEKAPKDEDEGEEETDRDEKEGPETGDEESTGAAAEREGPDAGPRQSPPVPLDAAATLPEKVPYASPAVRAFARELGVDLFRVTGSGRKGRILREDLTAFVKSVMEGKAGAAAGGLGFDLPAPPDIDFSKFGGTERQPLSRIRRISGRNLHRNWLSIPHVTHNDKADITAMERLRQKKKDEFAEQGFKLTPLVFLIKACVAALQEFPPFNASLDAEGEHLILKQYFNIGIAVDTDDGLVVPVIRDCDRKSVLDLARELSEVSQRARDKQLKPSDWQGACFTISSLGGIGGTAFNPIINAPEVAILGVSRTRTEPVWSGESFEPRLLLPLSLSYDHRVIDGASAARFVRFLAEYLEDEDYFVLD